MKVARQIGTTGRVRAKLRTELQVPSSKLQGPTSKLQADPRLARRNGSRTLRLAALAQGRLWGTSHELRASRFWVLATLSSNLAAIFLVTVLMAQVVHGQAPAGMTIGENTHMNAGAMLTFGYAGDYGDDVPSSHGLNWGLNGSASGYYYNPNFINFSVTPYYNQSRNDSDSQSLTGASGVNGTANFFTGSHFPGSVNYHFDRNSTGTFGLVGQPNFTTIGNSQGFGINWSALLPGLPTLTVGYSQGGGHSNVYGTDEEANSDTKLFNVRSTYELENFNLSAYYTHLDLNTRTPEFLASEPETAVQASANQTLGFGATHALPYSGTFYANYNRSTSNDNYSDGLAGGTNTTNYTTDSENVGATIHPTRKLSFSANESYISDLSGYLAQSIGTNGAPVSGINLGGGSHSITMGGGASYQITNTLGTSVQATYYDQTYLGQNHTGTFLSGNINYGKRLWNMFSFSGSVIDSTIDEENNALGFVGNVNYFRRIKGWETSGNFSYAQNVQTLLITYTTSYYNYTGNIHRRFGPGNQWHWSAGFGGSHSGLSQQAGTTNHSESYSTTFGNRRFSMQGQYTQGYGQSLNEAGTLIGLPPTPGVVNYILFNGSSYGGGISATPIPRLVVAATYNRAISNTLSQVISHNDTQIYNAQLQYHMRQIGLQAGYTRFAQGISAVGAPLSTTSYFVGVSRWFNLF